jgi:pimeloyl-ACP methyl ester carboxylesterase
MKSLFVLASSLATTSALPTRFTSGLDTNLDNVKSPYDYYLDQKLDHFDRSNKEVFPQRYFVNTTYWSGDGPVFLCVGGEGPPLTWQVLVASDHCNDMVELAPQVGALMLALEHRYYGPSTPNHDYSNENLRFLSSEQALGDIAHFHSAMSEKFKLTEANKWVSFGGSYPGMMAAMARLRYPHLFHAAVSSSSPLQAAVEMVGYNEIVAESMANEIVGGSQQCLEVIVEGHKAVGELLETESGRRELEEKFNICTPNALDDEANAEQFAGNGVVYLPVQSNDPVCKPANCNIEKICQTLTESSGTPLDRLISLHHDQTGDMCTPVNHELYLRAISNPKDSGRSWYYQTCTEWGYYMTCPVGSTCPYVQGLHKLSTDYEMCSRAFNIDQATVDDSIAFANDMYGGSDIQGTRIMYPNGEIDPWKANGVLAPPNDQSPVMMVTGASHHAWTHAAKDTDSEYVVAAKQAIWDQVTLWLKED